MKKYRNALWFSALLLILVWFNSGIESFRNGDLGDIPQHHEKLFSPPWLPFRAYASRNGEEKLYWNYSNLVLGKPYDLDYLAQKRQGDLDTNRKALLQQISPQGPRLIYRDFPFEYPPMALIPILLPRIFARDLPSYRLAYGIMVALMILGTAWAASQIQRFEWREFTLLILALGPILVTSYDIFPALLCALAYYFLSRSKPMASGSILGAAVLLKLYPVFLLALWSALLAFQKPRSQWQSALRMISSCALTIAALSAPFLWLVPKPFLQTLFLYGNRPFEIESIPGALLVWISGKSTIFGSFGSFNAHAPAFLLGLWSLLLPLGIVSLIIIAMKRSFATDWIPDTSVWTLCLLLWVLLSAKVLSPQYLIWLLPWAILIKDRSVKRCILIAAAITQIYYPFLFDFISEQGNRWAVLLVIARNTALALAFYKIQGRGTDALPGPA